MASIMSNIMSGSTGMNDQVIANDMLAGDKALATAYFMAQLESATPEVRRIYSQYANQKAQEHEALTKLSVEKGWYNAYESTSQLLKNVYDQAGDVVDKGNRQ